MRKTTHITALLVLLLSTCQLGCESKTERKAENVAQAGQEVLNTEQAGGTKQEVMAKQADLDSARNDFRKTWNADRDKVRRKLNREIEDIDGKMIRYERGLKTAKGTARTRLTAGIGTLKKERATMTGLLVEIDQVTAETWGKTRKAIETANNGVNDRVNALKAD